MLKHIIVTGVIGSVLAVSGMAQADDKAKKIYDTKCIACHAAGVAGAPKLDDKAAWAPRLAGGIDALVASAKKGKNAMPPMGTCMECSDEEMRAVIEYMTSAVK